MVVLTLPLPFDFAADFFISRRTTPGFDLTGLEVGLIGVGGFVGELDGTVAARLTLPLGLFGLPLSSEMDTVQ
jgi:hypothetical protein